MSKIQSLKSLIIEKDSELYKLKNQLQNFKNLININIQKINNNTDKCVAFISNDEKIVYGIPCSGDSTFAEIEEKFYREYPEYRETKNIFFVNGKEILRFKTIDDNKIGNGKPIMFVSTS